MDKPKFEFSIIQLMNRLGEQAPEWDSVTRCPHGKTEKLGKLRTNEYTLRIVEDGKSELVHLWVYVEPAENNTHLITADVTINHNARRMVIENTLCDEPVTGFVYQAISVFIKEMYKHRAEHQPEGPKPKTKLEVAAERLADASKGIQAEIDKASQKTATEQPEKQDTRPNNLAREISDEWIDSHPSMTFAEQVKLAEVITSTSPGASKQEHKQLNKYLTYLFADELLEKGIDDGYYSIKDSFYISQRGSTAFFWDRNILTYPGITYEIYILEATKLSTANSKSYVLLALDMKDGYVRICLLRAFTVSTDTGINPSGPLSYLIVKSGGELDYLAFSTDAGEVINIALANIAYANITHGAVLDWFWNGWGEPDQTPTAVDKSEDTITPDTTDKKAAADADYKWVKHVGGDNILVPTETVKGFIKNLFSSMVDPGLPANKDPEKIRWHIFYGVYQTNQYIGFTEYTYAGEAVDWVFFRNPALDTDNQTGYACLIIFQSGKYVDSYVEFSVDPDNLITYGESYHTRVENHQFKICSEGGVHYPSLTVLLDLCHDYILEQAQKQTSEPAEDVLSAQVPDMHVDVSQLPIEQQEETATDVQPEITPVGDYGKDWVTHLDGGFRNVAIHVLEKFTSALFEELKGVPGVPGKDILPRWGLRFLGIVRDHTYTGFYWTDEHDDVYRWIFYRNTNLDEWKERGGFSCLILKVNSNEARYVEFAVNTDDTISYVIIYNVYIKDKKVCMTTGEITPECPLPGERVLTDLVYDYIQDHTKNESIKEAQEQTSKPIWINSRAGETEFIDDDVLHEELTKLTAEEFHEKGITSSLGQVSHSDGVPGDNYWRVYDIVGVDQMYKTFMLRTPSIDFGDNLGYTFLVVGIVDNIVHSGLIKQVRVSKRVGIDLMSVLSIGVLPNGRLCTGSGWCTSSRDNQELWDAKKSLADVLGWFRASYGEEE